MNSKPRRASLLLGHPALVWGSCPQHISVFSALRNVMI